MPNLIYNLKMWTTKNFPRKVVYCKYLPLDATIFNVDGYRTTKIDINAIGFTVNF